MGNDQPKKLTKASKGQIDIACLKAKIHLQLCRDRKHAEIIKGEKELVNKIKSKSRNKVEEILIAERVVNGLKYAQACNLLMSCAATLRGHALFLAQNQDKVQKMTPWLPLIYSLIYGADHLGLSSLNEFKSVMKALNDPVAVPNFTNPQILQLLTPSPSPQELNVYVLEMSERNGIALEEINMVGHQFTKNFRTPEELAMEKQIAEQMKKNYENGNWEGGDHFNGNQGFNRGFNGGGQQGGQGFNGNGGFNGGQGGQQGGQGFNGNGGFNGGQGGQQGGQGFNGNGGFNGGLGGQGGQGFNGNGGFNGGIGGQGGQGGQGFNGNGGFNGGIGGQGGQGGINNGGQGGFNGQGGQGGFNGGGQGGFGGPNQNNVNPYEQPVNNVNPYLSGKSNINVGPNFADLGTIKKINNQKPRQFGSYEDIIGFKEDPNNAPMYPSIDPTKVSIAPYKPYDSKGNIANPFERQSVVNVNNKGQPTTTPTISQILRDFK